MHRTARRPLGPTPQNAPDLEQCAHRIAACLDLRACRFEPFPFDSQLPRIERDRVVIPAIEPAMRPHAEWKPEDGVELPVRYRRLTLGRFVLVTRQPTCGVAIPSTERAVAIEIARQAGDALARLWIASDRRERAERGLLP